MRINLCCLIALLLAGVSFPQPPQPTAPQTVEIPSGNLRLQAYLWTPSGHGPFPPCSSITAAATLPSSIGSARRSLRPLRYSVRCSPDTDTCFCFHSTAEKVF